MLLRTRLMAKRPCPFATPPSKQPRILAQLGDLPYGVNEIILDKLDSTDLFNAMLATKSMAGVAQTGLYASKRLHGKYGKGAFPFAAFRANAYQDDDASVAPGSVVHTLVTRYNSSVFAIHPETGYASIHKASMEGNAPLMRLILSLGEAVDRPFPGDGSRRAGFSPLMLAMEMSGGKMTDVIEDLINHGASEDYVCPSNGYNALHFAATLDSAECLSALIARGWDVLRVTSIGNTSMMVACSVDVVETLYLEAPVLANKARESDGVTPLMCMAQKDHQDAMRRLLELGAYVNAKDICGANAAFYASTTGVLDYLDDAGVDIFTYDAEGMSPLHYAATMGAYDVAEIFIWEYKLNIFHRNTANNMSPLDIAVKNGHYDIVRLILEYCPFEKRDTLLLQYAYYEGQLRYMPVHLAVESGNVHVLEQLLRWYSREQLNAPDVNSVHGNRAVHLAVQSLPASSAVFSILANYGADFNALNNISITPLYIACNLGKRDTVQRLIRMGANVNAPLTVYGHRSPLHGALESLEEDADIVQMLVMAGADVSHVPDSVGGTTMLHIAARNNKPGVLQVLLPHASRELLDAVCSIGLEVSGTALHCAVQVGAQECMELLIAAGADTRIRNQTGMTPYELACAIHAQDVADGFPWSIQDSMAARLSELDVEVIEVLDEL